MTGRPLPPRDAMIWPGATLGILGGGQLGRMLAQAAAALGYTCHVYSPRRDCPAASVAAATTPADFEDAAALAAFADAVDVVTLEWENIPVATLERLAQRVAVRPGPRVLAICQDRLAEKAFLAGQGLPVAPHAPVTTEAELAAAQEKLTFPAVLKTARLGYDGHGQRVVATAEALPAAWEELSKVACVVEEFVDFEQELSILVARNPAGQVVVQGPMANVHADHILDVTVVPPTVRSEVLAAVEEIGQAVAAGLALEGLVCVELFLTRDERLLINELAPRPHNSGHWTIDGAVTSQFSQLVRAVCNLPLGVPDRLRPTAMANLLGDLWQGGEPDWAAALAHDGVSLHLYGKTDPRPGRKMGHLTAVAETAELARGQALAARAALTAGRPTE